MPRAVLENIEVANKNQSAPFLGRTFLSVDSCTWDKTGRVTELVTTHPHRWQGPLPGNVPYTALVLSREYIPVRV